MKILIVYTNTYRSWRPRPGRIPGCLQAAPHGGHQVRLLDLMFSRSPPGGGECCPRVPAGAGRLLPPERGQPVYSSLLSTRCPPCNPSSPQCGLPGGPTLLGGTAFTTFPSQYWRRSRRLRHSRRRLDPISRFVASWPPAGRPLRAGAGAQGRNPAFTATPRIRGYSDTAFDGWISSTSAPIAGLRRLLGGRRGGAHRAAPSNAFFCDTFRTYGRKWVLRDPARWPGSW